MTTKPAYKLTEHAFINDRMHHPGEVVHTDLPPGPHMVPAKDAKGKEDPEARAAKEKAGDDPAPMPSDPKFIGDLINKNLAGGGHDGERDDGSIGQQAPPGVKVDAAGQVRGVTEKVGTGDKGDGANAPAAGGDVGKPAKPSP